jgi:HK97 gp10 family phage protein
VTIRVEGLKELDRALSEMKTATARGTVRRAMLKALQPMADEASRLAPDDPRTTGQDLHRSIKVGDALRAGRSMMTKGFGFGDGQVTVWMGPTREGYPQAIMQEFGTVKQPAQPYMRPAWDAGKTQLLEDFSTNMGAEITKTAERAARKAARKAGL